ncbi:unnamed protein product [Protopolystoma xenopodis]|uniref:Uncharacterized protein n=1 Tax=Protopolystoma xenopodis TaxID=117903 RepID=A0A448X1P9_9PLAT|nr:unnamed protein product [Protopolystoma xenopodis]
MFKSHFNNLLQQILPRYWTNYCRKLVANRNCVLHQVLGNSSQPQWWRLLENLRYWGYVLRNTKVIYIAAPYLAYTGYFFESLTILHQSDYLTFFS